MITLTKLFQLKELKLSMLIKKYRYRTVNQLNNLKAIFLKWSQLRPSGPR